jgi:hypothetical protein
MSLRHQLLALLLGAGAALCAIAAHGAPASRAATGYTVYPAAKYRTFHIRGTHGTNIAVYARGEMIEVLVFQLRRSGLAEYRVQGTSANDHIKARFPGLGHIDMRWKPSGKKKITSEPQGDCKGRRALVQEGSFVGDFSFRGEGGYTEGKIARVKGLSIRSFREVCKGLDAGPEPSIQPEEALLAYVSNAQRKVSFQASARESPGGRIEEFEAGLIERRPNLVIRRFTFGGGEPIAGRFTFDHGTGTAKVTPPEPFLGSADLNSAADEPWTGDLAVPFLGVGKVRLAGSGFKARLTRRDGGVMPLARTQEMKAHPVSHFDERAFAPF